MSRRKTKSKKTRSLTKNNKKQSSTLMKLLETVVVVGAVAGVLIKVFKGEKSKKK